MDCKTAKEVVRIDEFLKHFGIEPAITRRNAFWYHSPWSTDRTPSLEVSLDGKIFKDWSSGHSGTIIDFVTEYLSCSISEALQYLSISSLSSAAPSARPELQKASTNSQLKILHSSKDISKTMLGYAYGRGIHREIIHSYCEEVLYYNAGGCYFGLGFHNNKGGYEIRSKYFKGSTSPKGITTINDLCDCTFLVFEGFFDFLSAAELRWFDPMSMNAVVMNSTSNIKPCIEGLKNARRIICLLDNDTEGRKKTAQIIKAYPSAIDKASFYSSVKDVNEYLITLKK